MVKNKAKGHTPSTSHTAEHRRLLAHNLVQLGRLDLVAIQCSFVHDVVEFAQEYHWALLKARA